MIFTTSFTRALGVVLLTLSAQVVSSELAVTDKLMQEKLEYDKAGVGLIKHWQQEQGNLQSLMANYQVERKLLRQKIASAHSGQDDAAIRRQLLAEQQAEMESNAASFQQLVDRASTVLLKLWPSLPEPIIRAQQAELNVLINSQADLSKRMTAFVNLLQAIEGFNRVISLDQSMLTLEGQQWQAEVLYLGLGKAIFRLPDGSRAGVGQSSAGGWQWQMLENTRQVNDAFAIYLQQQSTELVNLPLMSVDQEGH